MGSLFRNPLGDIWDEFVTMQGYELPAKIEMKMMNCLEAYGLPQGYYKCEDLIQDYFELYSQNKAVSSPLVTGAIRYLCKFFNTQRLL